MANNSINNTIINANFTVPNGTITANGDISSTVGDLIATAGAVDAFTTVTAGTGLTVTTGNADILTGNVSVGTAAPANPARISVEESVAGTTGMSIQNTLVNANAAAVTQYITEPAAGDPGVNFVINGGQNWAVGIDNSDTDAFKITTGASPSAGTTVLAVTTGLAMSMPATSVTMNGGQLDFGTGVADDTVNMGTAANAGRTVNIGNGTGTSGVNIDSGSGDINLNVSINNDTNINTGTSTGAVAIGNNAAGAISLDSNADISLDANTASNFTVAGAADLTLNSVGGSVLMTGGEAATDAVRLNASNAAGGVDVDAGTGGVTIDAANGAITINSGTGALGISTDAAATTVNLATGGAAKTVTLGSTNSTSTTTVQSGTGGVAINTQANADITLSPGGTGTVSVTAAPIVPTTDRADSLGSATNSWDNVYADGVSFDDGTNVLSNYETGTWTPVLTFGGGSTGLTYTNQSGLYTRIGNVVTIQMRITLSAKGSSTGQAVISGLPVAVVGGGIAAAALYFSNLGNALSDQIMALLNNNNVLLRDVIFGSAAQALTDSDFADTTDVLVNASYLV